MWKYSHVLKIACYSYITSYQFTLDASSSSTTLKKEVVRSTETLISIYQSTPHHNQEHYNQHNQNPVCSPTVLTYPTHPTAHSSGGIFVWGDERDCRIKWGVCIISNGVPWLSNDYGYMSAWGNQRPLHALVNKRRPTSKRCCMGVKLGSSHSGRNVG